MQQSGDERERGDKTSFEHHELHAQGGREGGRRERAGGRDHVDAIAVLRGSRRVFDLIEYGS